VLNSIDGGGTASATLPGRAAKLNPSGMLSNGGIGKRLLTVAEAAGYLGLQVDTVYKKARLRELPSVKVGRALRFDVKALERFVEQHTIENID
jgi:excisionase family DNA binding protein